MPTSHLRHTTLDGRVRPCLRQLGGRGSFVASVEGVAEEARIRGFAVPAFAGCAFVEEACPTYAGTSPVNHVLSRRYGRGQTRLSEAGAIHRREITYPDGPIVHELEAFQYEYTPSGVRYAASAGMHDDCVCALPLAVRLFAQPQRHAIWPGSPRLGLTRPLRRGLAA